MNDIWITITTFTLQKILKSEKPETALTLYMFYYNCAKYQNTNQPWATVPFCMKGLGWGRDRVREARKTLKELGLIEDVRRRVGGKTYTKLKYITSENTLSNIFMDNDSTENPTIHNDSTENPTIHNDSTENPTSRNASPQMLKGNKNKILKKNKDLNKFRSTDSGESEGPKKKIRSPKPSIKSKPKPKSKYGHTPVDFQNYDILLESGCTKHKKDSGAYFDSLDKLHALLNLRCKCPYFYCSVPEHYFDRKWTIEEIEETFKFHIKHSQEEGKTPVKSIGQFICSDGFKGNKSWSPLVVWHQKMNKEYKNQLTDAGKKLHKSMKHKNIYGLEDLHGSVINKVADELAEIENEYVFVSNGKKRAHMYENGIYTVMAGYIKERSERMDFKLVFITKNGFVENMIKNYALKRNIMRKRQKNRSVLGRKIR